MGAVGLAFLVALVLAPALVRFAIGRNLLDVPNARSSHEVPTPRLGGLAVIAGVWAAAPFISETFLFLTAATLAGLVGVLDDFVDLPFWLKAAGQATVAFILLFLAPPPISLAAGPLWPVALLFGVVWVVALVNAYNFMDGIDGIAGGTAILNALFLATLLGTTGLRACLAVLAAGGRAVHGAGGGTRQPLRSVPGLSGRGRDLYAVPLRHRVYAGAAGYGAQEYLRGSPGARLPENHPRPG